jgi:hypothetical protein
MAPLSLLASIEFVRLSVGYTLSVRDRDAYAIAAYPYGWSHPATKSREPAHYSNLTLRIAPRVTERVEAKGASCAGVSRNAPR